MIKLKPLFKKINKQVFDDKLPIPKSIKYEKFPEPERRGSIYLHYDGNKPNLSRVKRIKIVISKDIKKRQLTRTLLHEMVHYDIWLDKYTFKQIDHGKIFKKRMLKSCKKLGIKPTTH